MPIVVFRADASPEIGGGHIMRCLALANILRDKGAEIWFACRTQTFDTLPILKNSKYNLMELPEHSSGHRELKDALPQVEWLIVDHYGLDANWITPLRGWAQHVMVIDDLADRSLDCDLLLDQTLGREDGDYRPLTPETCTYLLGPEFALLRPEFAALRSQCLTRRRTPTKQGPTKVLVALGATDPKNVTMTVLETLNSISTDIEITIVLGSGAPHLSAIRDTSISHRHPTSVLVDASDMATLMAHADIAIGASGTSSWERCCVGLPTIAIELADNQHEISRTLSEAGAITFLGRYETLHPDLLNQAVMNLISTPRHMEHMSMMAAEVCDGLGATRVAERILS